MEPGVWEAIGTCLAAVAALGSIIVAIMVWNGQKELDRQQKDLQIRLADKAGDLQKDIAEQRERFETAIANQSDKLQKDIAERNKQYTQRAQLLPLWQYISGLNHVKADQPVTPDVLRNTNALELVALCYEAGIVDQDVVRRTFRRTYIALYDEISRCGTLPGLNQDGISLLRDSPAAMNVYQIFQREEISQGLIPPMKESVQ